MTTSEVGELSARVKYLEKERSLKLWMRLFFFIVLFVLCYRVFSINEAQESRIQVLEETAEEHHQNLVSIERHLNDIANASRNDR